MKAGEILISGIFNGSRLLEVPFYQRAYVWSEEQWERMLEDLQYVTETRRQYFMGSIILKSGRTLNTWEKYSECKVVIDGQQRLTTLIIFMKVLCLKKGENKLFERDFILEDDSIALRHGQKDIEAFKKIIETEKAESITNSEPKSQIIEAFNYFCENLDETKYDRSFIRQNIQFVCIDLLEDEDAQQVFDTINSLGVRLTTAELLKNYFFDQNDITEYQKSWVEVFEKDDDARTYWDTEIESGRVRRSLIDIFFDAYFQLFVQNSKYDVKAEDKIMYARIDRLSKSYQHFINSYCDKDKNVVLSPLKEYAECFREIFDPTCCEGCIIRAQFLDKINQAYKKDPGLDHLMLDSGFSEEIKDALPAWRKIVATCMQSGIYIPAIANSLMYFDGYTSRQLPANLIQAQRDWFGAHTYQRIDHDEKEFFHTQWEKE